MISIPSTNTPLRYFFHWCLSYIYFSRVWLRLNFFSTLREFTKGLRRIWLGGIFFLLYSRSFIKNRENRFRICGQKQFGNNEEDKWRHQMIKTLSHKTVVPSLLCSRTPKHENKTYIPPESFLNRSILHKTWISRTPWDLSRIPGWEALR